MRVYLSGPDTGDTNWRNHIVPGYADTCAQWGDDDGLPGEWPVLKDGAGGHDFVGPYVTSRICSCHDVSMEDDREDAHLYRLEVGRLNTDALLRAEMVFSWIDITDHQPYLAEVGYAAALQIPVVIGVPVWDEVTFAGRFYIASWLTPFVVVAETPLMAFAQAIDVIMRRDDGQV